MSGGQSERSLSGCSIRWACSLRLMSAKLLLGDCERERRFELVSIASQLLRRERFASVSGSRSSVGVGDGRFRFPRIALSLMKASYCVA